MREGWINKKLGDCIKLKSGDGLTANKMVDGSYPVYGGNGIAGYHNEYNHETPQVIIGRVGALCGNARLIKEKFWLTDNAFKVNQGLDSFDPEFLVYYLNFLNLRSFARQAAQPVISNSSLKGVEMHYPESVTEQRQIVAILDEAFAAIDQAKANIEKNIQNAKELFQSIFSKKTNPDDNNWKMLTVKDVAKNEKGSMRTGPFGSQLLHKEFVEEGIAVLGIDNAVANEFQWRKERYITNEKFKQLSRFQVKPKDVLITIMGTCGRCAIVPDDIPTAINTKHLCCITLDQSKCLPEYLHAYFLYHPVAQQYLKKKAKGAIMAGLNMGIIKDMPLLLPSIAEQREVTQMMSQALKESQQYQFSLQNKLDNLEELKKSILQKAFAGELSASGLSGLEDKQDLKERVNQEIL